jgi:type I restriction enzyme S subunit
MSQVELTTLGESCEFFNGKAHEKSIDENGKYIVVNSKFISQEGKVVKRTKEQMFPLYKGDIVMVMSDVPNGKALAKCFIIDQDDTYSLNQRICCIRSKEFDTKYLYYQLNRHEHFLAFNNGENQTNLRKDDILDCPLIKPSMEEQRKMVAELDEALNKLQHAENNIVQNVAHVRELFESYYYSLFNEKRENWLIKTIGDICEKGSSNISQNQLENNEGEYPIFGASGFIKCVDFYHQDKKYLSIVKDGSGVGRVTLMEAYTSVIGTLQYILPNEDTDIDYLYYVLRAIDFKKYVAGAAIPHIYFKDYKKELVLWMPLVEQKVIAEKLKRLSDESERLLNLYQSKLKSIDELKSGILKRAFENELIEAE